MNKIILATGIAVVALAASLMFCQERCFLGVDLQMWPAAIGILGIGMISASNFIPLKGKKKGS